MLHGHDVRRSEPIDGLVQRLDAEVGVPSLSFSWSLRLPTLALPVDIFLCFLVRQLLLLPLFGFYFDITASLSYGTTTLSYSFWRGCCCPV